MFERIFGSFEQKYNNKLIKNIEKMIFGKFEHLLKTISDDGIEHPKGHPSIPGTGQFFIIFSILTMDDVY